MNKKEKIIVGIFAVVIVALLIGSAFLHHKHGGHFDYHDREHHDEHHGSNDASNEDIKDIEAVFPETTYIHPVDWPPTVQILDQAYSCTEAGLETGRAGETRKVQIEGREFCVTKISEGAAGSTYTQYAYATEKAGKTAVLTFTLKAVQCGNYEEPQKTACETERAKFNIDSVISGVLKRL